MKKMIPFLLALIAAVGTQAQVVNVCGTDSIFLQVENYDGRGVIEWQESIDSINWVTIPEIVGEMYKFFPTQTKYYRAVVKTSSCDPLYSAFSFVQLPPVANAGSDKLVGGKSTILLGNQLLGATSEWTVLEGDSGIIAEPRNPYSQFSGKYNVPYKLKWTVTNGCGQSSDTINVQFEVIIAKNNFIIIDNTDTLYSDSTEMESGMYRIKFSDPTIVPADSVVLIGMREDFSFLRKVVSFSLQDSIYSFTTIQGTLEDIFKNGRIDFGSAINQGLLIENGTPQGSKVKGLSTFPTRQSLNELERSEETKVIYTSENYNASRVRSDYSNDITEEKEFSIPLPQKDILSLSNASGSLKISVEDFLLKLTPNFVSSFDIWPFNFKFGMDNAIVSMDYTTKIEATGSFNYGVKDIELMKPFKKSWWVTVPILFPPYVAPLKVTLNIKLLADAEIGLEAGITITKKDNYKNYTTIRNFKN